MQNFGGANKVYYGGCPNDECYFRKAEASFTHISEITQQDKGDNNFSSKNFPLNFTFL